jgi:hypothetical protein
VIIVKLSFLASLIDGPTIVQLELVESTADEQLNGLFDIDDSLNEEADIGLLLHLVPALINHPIKAEPAPLLSALVEESDYAVEKIDGKA